MKKFLLSLSLIVCCSIFSKIYASHVMGADLTFACQGPNTYLVTLQVYRDCNGIPLSGPLDVNYSSAQCNVNSTLTLNQVGPPTDITPICFSGTDACNGGSGYGIQKYIFQGVLHLPAGCGSDWVLSWTLCCRNAAITTLSNPGSENLYIEAHLNNTLPNCDSSPTFSNDPIGIYCANFPQLFNHGAVDPNGDSLYFYLMPSLNGPGSSVAYNSGYGATTPLATTGGTGINSSTGQLGFIPSQTQVAVMKVGVNEYRNGVLIGHIERDMQLIVTNCNNSAPTSLGINGQTGANATTFTTTACSNFCFTIQTADANTTDSVFYTWINNNLPGATISSSGGLKPLLTICWAPTQSDVGSHNFVIDLRNNDCPYFGTSAIAYTVIVNPASDPPVNAGPDVTLCPGQTTTLTATSAGIVTSYTWSDGSTTHSGATWTVNPAITTVYTVTAAYSNGCALTDQVIVHRNPQPTVTAFPPVSTICSTSDTVQITAIATHAASYQWSPPGGLTCTTCPSPKASPTASTTYTVVAKDSFGCTSAPFNVVVNLNSPPPTQSCSVIYATPGGVGTGTQASPANLATALGLAQCNNALVKLAIGTYNIDYPITNIGSNTTIEGGFDPANNWLKRSVPGATTIFRSSLNPEGSSTTQRIVAIYLNGAQYLRFQDVTVQTANCPVIAATDTFGISNYVFHMTNCSNYNFVRCQIIPGNASGGRVGTSAAGAGAAGANGQSASGNSTAGAAPTAGANIGGGGGNGGSGGTISGGSGTAGSPGNAGAAGGGSGSGSVTCASFGVFSGSAASPGAIGGAGALGSTGAGGAGGSFGGGFYVVGSLGGNGGAGGPGGGGGGGGGAGGAGGLTDGSGGGSGGNGSMGGPGGSGGAGGGGCFGMFMNNNGANGVILQCNIGTISPGAGGPGGIGGNGGTGGTGGSGGQSGSNCQNFYGNGGNGGNGGRGGDGGSGGTGTGARVYIASGSALATGDSVFSLIAQPTIYTSNISCTHRDDMDSSAASGNWTTGAGATVPAGTGTQITTQYTTTGRKDIGYSGNTYDGFAYIALDQSSFIPVIQSSAHVLNGDTFYVCKGSTANFNIQIASADTFDWNFGGATVPNTYTGHNDQNLTNLTFNTAGTFMITGRIKTSCCGWSPYDTVYLLVEPNATLGYTGTTSFCAGDSAHVLLTGSGVSYSWMPTGGLSSSTGSNVYAFPQATTSYLVTSYSPRGLCNVDTPITIKKDTVPTISFTILPASCGSNGSATAVPSPAGPYTYHWNPTGLNTATISSQPSGTYNVTVTPSGSSCSTTAATSIGTGGGLQAYFAKTISPLCNAACTGQLRVEAIGGAAPYTYHWGSNASILDSLNNLCSGTYSVIITDNNGCTAAATQLLSQPLPLSVAVLDSLSPHCAGQCSGSAKVDGQGGTGPYSFIWSAPSTSDSSHAINLCAGHYTISVTDHNGCPAAGGVTITTPQAMTLSFTKVNDSCFGLCDGQIRASVTLGTPPYTYLWNNGTTGAKDSNLCAAIYTVTVKDSFLCAVTAADTIAQPLLLTASIVSSINDSCFGLCNGRAKANAIGGTGPYTFVWSGTGTTGPLDSNLCIGIYTVTVRDAMGCTAIAKDTITQPVVLTTTTTVTNVTCFGLCNGRVMANPTGGTAPYVYLWNNGEIAKSDTNLCIGGPYTVTVQDHNGCTITHTDNITQPTQLTIAVTNTLNDSCFGYCKGSITVFGAGGTPNLTYLWSDGNTGATDNQLCANTYMVTVTDGNLCTATVSQTISQPTQLVADTFSTRQVSCFGGSDGKITLEVAGGTYPYTYVWPQAPSITDSLGINLAAGLYTPTVTDNFRCTATVNITLTQPNILAPYVAILDSISCFGATDGGVTIDANGGTIPYTYQLDGAGGFQASGIFPGLSSGTHTVTVQDLHNCDSIISFIIYEPTQVSASITLTINDSCFGSCKGMIVAQGAGGVQPYQYALNGGAFSASDTFSGLCANPSETIHVLDNHGCPASVIDSVTQPTALLLTFVSALPPTCNNGTDGSFIVNTTGGTPGYTYSDGGVFQNSPSFAPEAAGYHLVTVKDANGCTDTLTVIVPNPPPTSSFDTVVTAISCFGGCNGTITLTLTGTVTPYTFAWSNVALTQNLTNLCTGTYVITITDGHGCRVYGPDSIPVTQPGQISATDVMSPVSCFGGTDGAINLTPAGGVSPIGSSWSNGSTSSNPTGLTAGSYSDTLTDANGCRYVDANILVTQPNAVAAIVDSVIQVSCIGYSNGGIYLSDTGGTPGYTYSWSPSGNTNPLTGIPVGSYTVTVFDSHNCTATTTITVGVDSPIVLNATKSNVFCPPLHDGRITLTVTGGSPAYQYSWSNGSTNSLLTNLSVGVDSVTITDSRGCTLDTGFVISNDSTFKVKPIPDTATINEGDLIRLGLQISGDNAASITWLPGLGLSCADCPTPDATPVHTTDYIINVVSDSGCTAITAILVTVIPQHQLYIPNAFTPNGDGKNDLWEAYGNKKVWIYLEVQVFDRWGERIFESNDLNYQWDGKYRGTLMEPGEYVYTFTVTFLDGYTVNNKGSITLIR